MQTRPEALLRAAVLALAASAPVAAQDTTQIRQEWRLEDLRSAWCVHFLMDSTEADKRMPSDLRPIPAAGFPSLVPAVKAVVEGEPVYASWIPAEFCVIHAGVAQIGGQRLASDDTTRDLDQAQTVTWWLIGARPVEGPDPGPGYFAVKFRSSNWRFVRSAETALISMEYQESEAGKSPDSGEDLYTLDLGHHNTITWEGHLAGASAFQPPPLTQRWLVAGSRGLRTRARFELRAAWAQPIAGTLHVAGRDDLARALKGSPIRMVGPMLWGGEAQVVFEK